MALSLLSLPLTTSAAADNANSAEYNQVSKYCTNWGSLFSAVADLRDKGTDPSVVIDAILRSEFPDEVKRQARQIVMLVYTKLAEVTPEQMGPVVYGMCMKQVTGVQRNA